MKIYTITLNPAYDVHAYMEKVKAFLKALQEKGAKIVLDSKSFSLEDIYEVQPRLIKPNQEEISEYLGCEINNLEDAIAKAQIFADHGVTNVMVSLGEQGALLLHSGKCCIATPLPFTHFPPLAPSIPR